MGGWSLADDEARGSDDTVDDSAGGEADVGAGRVLVVLLSFKSLLVRGSRGATEIGALGAAGAAVRTEGGDDDDGGDSAVFADDDAVTAVSASLSVSYSDASSSDCKAASTSNLSHFWYAA